MTLGRALALVVLLGGCAAPAPALTTLADGRSGAITIATLSVADSGWVTSEPTITVRLMLPEHAGRVPAVILAHGCAGERGNIDDWMRRLSDMGYAALAVDSFTGRGVTEVCTGRQSVSPMSRVYDVYRALALLATHPRVVADRVALMGFSHGGRLTLLASQARFARRAKIPGSPDFAAYLPFYPGGCNVRLLGEASMVGGPMRIFHGGADDWTPIGPCRELAARLHAAGRDVSLVEYPAAHHAFDSATLPPALHRPDVLNQSACVIVQQPDGRFVDSDGRPMSGQSACIRRGATVGYNGLAHRQSIADVRAFLADVFGRR